MANLGDDGGVLWSPLEDVSSIILLLISVVKITKAHMIRNIERTPPKSYHGAMAHACGSQPHFCRILALGRTGTYLDGV